MLKWKTILEMWEKEKKRITESQWLRGSRLERTAPHGNSLSLSQFLFLSLSPYFLPLSFSLVYTISLVFAFSLLILFEWDISKSHFLSIKCESFSLFLARVVCSLWYNLFKMTIYLYRFHSLPLGLGLPLSLSLFSPI